MMVLHVEDEFVALEHGRRRVRIDTGDSGQIKIPARPLQVFGLTKSVVVAVVANPEVVRWGSDDDIDARWFELSEHLDAIPQMKDSAGISASAHDPMRLYLSYKTLRALFDFPA